MTQAYVSPLQRRPSLLREIHRDSSAPKDAAPCKLDKIPIDDLLIRVQNVVDEAVDTSAALTELLPYPTAPQRRRIRAILTSLFRSTLGIDIEKEDQDVIDFDIEARKALVFCFLRLKDSYSQKVGGDSTNAELYQFRAVISEVLATQCVQYGGWTMEELQTEVLTYRFCPIIPSLSPPRVSSSSDGSSTTSSQKEEERQADPENALECAIRTESHLFYKTPAVADCIRAIWRGQLRLVKCDAHIKGEYVEQAKSSFPHPSFVYSRVAMPMYQYFVIVALRLVNLLIYSTVIFTIATPAAGYDIDYQPPAMSGWEVCLYLFTFSFILHSAKSVYTAGWRPIFGKLWFWVDTATQCMTVIAFAFRMLSLVPLHERGLGGHSAMMEETAGEYSTQQMRYFVHALSLLSSIAPLVWLQLLNYLDLTQQLGPTIVILRGMLSKFLIFVPFGLFTMVGVAQGVIGLILNKGDYNLHPLHPWEMTKLFGTLGKGYFGESGYPFVREISGYYGQVLMAGHQITGMILVAALSAVMIEAFQTILKNKDEEYFFYFSFRILDYFKDTVTATEALTIPPFTVLQVVLYPMRLALPRIAFEVEHTLVLILLWPFAGMVALYEAVKGVDSVRDIQPSGILKGAPTSYNQNRKRTKWQKQELKAREANRRAAHEEISIVLHGDIDDGIVSSRSIGNKSSPEEHVHALPTDKPKPTKATAPSSEGNRVHHVRPSEVASDAFRSESNTTHDWRAQVVDENKHNSGKGEKQQQHADKSDKQHHSGQQPGGSVKTETSSPTLASADEGKENGQEEAPYQGDNLQKKDARAMPINPWSAQYEDTDEDLRWKSMQDRVGTLEDKLDRILDLLIPKQPQ